MQPTHVRDVEPSNTIKHYWLTPGNAGLSNGCPNFASPLYGVPGGCSALRSPHSQCATSRFQEKLE